MSRIGRKEITVPAGVTVTVSEANVVTVKGPKGTLETEINSNISVNVEGAVITVTRANDERENRALHGLSRTLIANMVEGVTNGYSKTLEIVGVGYKVAKSGKTLTLNLGHSHPITFEEAVLFRRRTLPMRGSALRCRLWQRYSFHSGAGSCDPGRRIY